MRTFEKETFILCFDSPYECGAQAGWSCLRVTFYTFERGDTPMQNVTASRSVAGETAAAPQTQTRAGTAFQVVMSFVEQQLQLKRDRERELEVARKREISDLD